MVGLKSPERSNCGNTGPGHSGSDTLQSLCPGLSGLLGWDNSSWVMFQPPALASAASVAGLIIPPNSS